jgi:hypothetical protein
MLRREELSPYNGVWVFVPSLTKKCGDCGADNRDEANYCLICGQSVVIRPSPETPEATKEFAPPPAVWQRPPIRGCLFHPTLPAQFTCGNCGIPVCFVCARYLGRTSYCPICYSRLVGIWMPRVSFANPRPVDPRFAYGCRLVR